MSEDEQLDGSQKDFSKIYKKILKDYGKQYGFETQQDVKDWLEEQELTPHHESAKKVQLIPSKLHNNIPHIGSASDLTNQKKEANKSKKD
ncbi:HNH endonuclease [Butyrivibrio sp. JL13D10]|uniref:HNH endonuclease n=1 Tax=Butyrivibrio sp. JL13D10 TaxID=3236815 RepID=UPI0038B47600